MSDADGTRRQLRFALSMNGGVSLAVWIGGAVAEIDTMRAGEGFWGDLLWACGYQRAVQVDVMSGASAGGLNAVMMAQAIRSNTPFSEKYLKLWQDSADIATLVKAPLHSTTYDERAVFNGEYFLRELYKALDEPAVAGDLPHDLSVFASATLVRPDDVEFRDVPGAPIVESRSDAYFHIARRGTHARGLDGFQPSQLVIDNRTALAMVGRATSSLPGLFEPVCFHNGPPESPATPSERFGSRLVGAFTRDRDMVEIMDGGVTDNVPIARAIRAIANSQARSTVRRVLLYLHPDPAGTKFDGDPRDIIGVVRSFFGKRAETIREDIEVLRLHNDAVLRRAATAKALLHDFVGGGRTIEMEPAAALAVDIAKATLLRAAIDPAGDLPWHAPNVGRLSPLVDGPSQPSKADLRGEIDAALAARPDALVAMQSRRVVIALQRLIDMASRTQPDDGFHKAIEGLNDCLLLCDVINSYQLACFLGHGGGGGPAARLLSSVSTIEGIRVQQLGSPEPAVWHALASWSVVGLDGPGGTPLLHSLGAMITAAIDALPEMTGDDDAVVALRACKSAPADHATIDRLFLPLAAEPTASDQHIDFVRIAGNVASPAAEAFLDRTIDRGPKIAGTQLGHLGAFFRTSWRTNDWWWGRLDAVGALLDALLDEQAIERLFASGFLGTMGTTPAATSSVADVKLELLRLRQQQLIDEHLHTTSADLDDAVATEQFNEWADDDRRLSSLVGTRSLTSTAIRGVITGAKAVQHDKGALVHGGMVAGRPVLLAMAGSALAGRRAAAAATWTLCALAAPRSSKPAGKLGLYLAGIALALAIIWLAEAKIRPTATSRLWPYLWVVLGAGLGGFACRDRSWFDRHEVPILGWSCWWVLAAVSASVAAWMLFFWMYRPAMLGMIGASFVLYGGFAYRAARHHTPHHVWFDVWPLRALWVAWLIAIFGFPLLIGVLPDKLLKPSSATT